MIENDVLDWYRKIFENRRKTNFLVLDPDKDLDTDQSITLSNGKHYKLFWFDTAEEVEALEYKSGRVILEGAYVKSMSWVGDTNGVEITSMDFEQDKKDYLE